MKLIRNKQSPTRTPSTTAFRHNRGDKRKQRFIVGVILFAVLIFIFSRGSVSSVTAGFIHKVVTPFWEAEIAISNWIEATKYYFLSKEALVIENNELQAKLDAQMTEAITRDALRDENDILKAKLGRISESGYILANVLAAPDRSAYDTLIIDLGSSEGIAISMRIYGEGDFAIGEVTQIFKHSSVVTLYSSSGSQLSGFIGSSTMAVIVHGSGGGNFFINLPKGVKVSEGDVVSIPDLAPTFVAVVEDVEADPGSSFQNLFLRLPVNLHLLRHVYVQVPKQKNTINENQ